MVARVRITWFVIALVATSSGIVISDIAPSAAAVGGIRVAVRMPYSDGGNTGFESPSTHHHYFTSGFAWDLLKGLNREVSARAASSDGTVSIHVGLIGTNSHGAGQWVEVQYRVNGTKVGTIWYSHLRNLQVAANHNYPVNQPLGYTGNGKYADKANCGSPYGGYAYGYPYSASFQVCTPSGVHTHVDVANACWRSLSTNLTVGPSTGIIMLSTKYAAGHNGACDKAELDSVNSGKVAPKFTASSPPSTGKVGTNYTYQFKASGSPTPTFTRASGSFPPGLALSSAGKLAGTPTAVGTYSFTVRASNSAGSATTPTRSITVARAPTFTASTPPASGTVGSAYAYQFAASGSPTPTFSKASGSLPPGLSLTSAGNLSGTPTTIGTFSFAVKASNSAGTATTPTRVVTVAAPSPWHITGSYLPPAAPQSISCPAVDKCIAVGADTIVGTDDGETWFSQRAPVGMKYQGYGVPHLTSTSCGSVLRCVAVGYYDLSGGGVAQAPNGAFIASTSNGGGSWTSSPVPSSSVTYGSSLSGVSCVGPTCVAVGGAPYPGVITSGDGGATWSARAFPSDLYPTAVACPSASECIAVGSTSENKGAIARSTNGGVTWSAISVPTGISYLGSVACPSAASCVAVGAESSSNAAVLRSDNGGVTWASQAIPSGVTPLGGVSCHAPTTCVAVGTSILSSADAGASWSSRTLTGVTDISLSGVSCASSSECRAVGDSGIAESHDGGTTWSVGPPPTGVNSLYGVSCEPLTRCVAVGVVQGVTGEYGGVLQSTDSGGTWAVRSVPPSSFLFAVSCASDSQCIAVGYDNPESGVYEGAILRSIDGGDTWSSQVVPAGVSALQGVSCPSISLCIAVGWNGAIVLSADGGLTWSSQTAPNGAPDLRGVSCASTEVCVAVSDLDHSIVRSVDGGATWTTQASPSGIQYLAVSCRESSLCVAVGRTDAGSGAIVISGDGGETWSSATIPTGTSQFEGVSCGSTTNCVAVGTANNSSGYPAGGRVVATTDAGVTWSNQTLPAGIVALHAVSCASTSPCTIAGGNLQGGGVVATDAPPPGPPTNLNATLADSCTNALAVGGPGTNVVFSWSPPTTGGPPTRYVWSLTDNFTAPIPDGPSSMWALSAPLPASQTTSGPVCLRAGTVQWSVEASNAAGGSGYPPNETIEVP